MSRRGAKKSSRFDINPLIGVVMALGLIGAGHVLEGGRMGSLAQFAAGLIVFGGTLGAVLISFSFGDLRHAIGALRHMFIDQAKNPEDVIAAIGRFAVKARKEGIMKLEDDVDQTDDPFLQRGIVAGRRRRDADDDPDDARRREHEPLRCRRSAGARVRVGGRLCADGGHSRRGAGPDQRDGKPVRSDQARIGHRRRVRRDGLRRRLRQPDLPPDRDQAADDRGA